MTRVVGKIFGEVSYGDFKFIVGNDINLPKGEYVKVDHEAYGWVLAQVSFIKRYNEMYSLNAITGNSHHKNDLENTERIIAEVKVLGYIDGKGMLKAPKIPFKPGDSVYEADGGIIKRSLGMGIRSGIYLGLLDGHAEAIPVYLSVNKLVQKHVCILAKTGAGKSYTVGVLVEELLEKKVPVVIIDPHGEYASLKASNDNPRELAQMRKYGISPKGYGNIIEFTPYPQVNPRANKKLTLDITRLKPRDIIEILPVHLSDSQKGILFEAIKTAKGFGKYGIKDLINIVHEHELKAKWNLINSLEVLKESKIFEGKPTYPMDLVKRNMVSIINLRGVSPDIQEIVVTRLTHEIFEARKRGKVPPFLYLLEEAHNFAPERGLGQSIASRIMRTIATEGRKFGMGLCVVSQRPARIDKNVLSQCNTQIILKVTNPNDMRAISQSIEGFTPDLEEEIKQLQPGVALVVGETVEQPIFVDVRVKRSKHGGASIDLVREAQKAARAPRFEGFLKKILFR